MRPALRIAQLLALLKRVDGRKKLQKLVHILKEIGYPFSERFEYSYYGMYSKELRAELDSLTAEDLVREHQAATPFGNPQFSFESTDQLEALLEQLGVEREPEWAALAKRLNGFPPHVLEGVSTILFLSQRGLAGEALKLKLLALKPHLADAYDQCEREAQAILADATSS
jgi:uncharacterized protein